MDLALIQETLWQQRFTIAAQWQSSVERFENHSSTNITHYFVDIVEKSIMILLSSPFDAEAAHAIGKSFANTHHIHPNFLVKIITTMGNNLVMGLTLEQRASVHPNLIHLISQLLYGYSELAYSFILGDQEKLNDQITKLQEQANELSSKQDNNWQNLFNRISDPLILHDGKRIIKANPATCQLLGYESSDLTGELILLLFAPWTHNNIQLTFNTAKVNPYETAVSKQDGTTITIQFYNLPIYYKQQDNFIFVFKVLALPELKKSPSVQLTNRECQVLQMIAADNDDEAVANLLGITPRTVRFHWQNILKKLGVSSRAGAINKAWQLEILHNNSNSN